MNQKVDIMRRVAVASFGVSGACILALIVAGIVACTTPQIRTGLQVGSAICEAIQVLGPPIGAYASGVGDKALAGGGPPNTWTLTFENGVVIESTDGKTISAMTRPDAP